MIHIVGFLGIFHVNWVSYWPELWRGGLMTIEFTAASFAGSVVVGLVLALMRESHVVPIRGLARLYTEIFKNLPLLTEIFIVYFGLASLGIKFDVFEAGSISLIVFYAAYLSEIFRAGLEGVPSGQREAAYALGLSDSAVYSRVVLPQAARLALPGTTTMLVDMLKSTSLLITIAGSELMTVGQLIASQTFRAMEVYFVIGAIYFAMCFPLSQLSIRIEQKLAVGTPITPSRRRIRSEAHSLQVASGGTK